MIQDRDSTLMKHKPLSKKKLEPLAPGVFLDGAFQKLPHNTDLTLSRVQNLYY